VKAYTWIDALSRGGMNAALRACDEPHSPGFVTLLRLVFDTAALRGKVIKQKRRAWSARPNAICIWEAVTVTERSPMFA